MIHERDKICARTLVRERQKTSGVWCSVRCLRLELRKRIDKAWSPIKIYFSVLYKFLSGVKWMQRRRWRKEKWQLAQPGRANRWQTFFNVVDCHLSVYSAGCKFSQQADPAGAKLVRTVNHSFMLRAMGPLAAFIVQNVLWECEMFQKPR